MEYEQLKAQSFFNDILIQMKQAMCNDEQKLQYIDDTQDLVKKKACILSPKEIIAIIGRLTRELDMEIDEGILLDKFESISLEKDKVF